jgi:hypothetical protein
MIFTSRCSPTSSWYPVPSDRVYKTDYNGADKDGSVTLLLEGIETLNPPIVGEQVVVEDYETPAGCGAGIGVVTGFDLSRRLMYVKVDWNKWGSGRPFFLNKK